MTVTKVECDHIFPVDQTQGCLKCGAARPDRIAESDPHGKNPHQPGAKLDAGKAPVLRGVVSYFPRALTAVAQVSEIGARKYTWRGWESVPDGVNRYGDALVRHLIAEDFGPRDADTGLLHAAHEAWNALARLELMLREDPDDA